MTAGSTIGHRCPVFYIWEFIVSSGLEVLHSELGDALWVERLQRWNKAMLAKKSTVYLCIYKIGVALGMMEVEKSPVFILLHLGGGRWWLLGLSYFSSYGDKIFRHLQLRQERFNYYHNSRVLSIIMGQSQELEATGQVTSVVKNGESWMLSS